jgi:hypothetical protein
MATSPRLGALLPHEIPKLCENTEHKAISCSNVSAPSERKRILAEKRLCFNCAIGQHAASSCKSKISCQNCQKRDQTSICPSSIEVGLTANVINSESTCVVHPVVIVQVKGIKFRALLDSGASNSFVSETLVGVKVVKTSTRQISTLMDATTTKMSQFDLSHRTCRYVWFLSHAISVKSAKQLTHFSI